MLPFIPILLFVNFLSSHSETKPLFVVQHYDFKHFLNVVIEVS
jgi:hypothetical protein